MSEEREWVVVVRHTSAITAVWGLYARKEAEEKAAQFTSGGLEAEVQGMNGPGVPGVPYDSTADTLRHSQRVGELMAEAIKELVDRSMRHDRSKTEEPELSVFNEYTPKLKHSTYGSPQYQGHLEGMDEGLQHHYAHNRHHPDHFEDGIAGMTLVDLIEMLADWKAATERHEDGDLVRSLDINMERFGISDQLMSILIETAMALGWME